MVRQDISGDRTPPRGGPRFPEDILTPGYEGTSDILIVTGLRVLQLLSNGDFFYVACLQHLQSAKPRMTELLQGVEPILNR